MKITSYIFESSELVIQIKLDFDHPKCPLAEVRCTSIDSLVASEFHTDPKNLGEIAKFFAKVAKEAGA